MLKTYNNSMSWYREEHPTASHHEVSYYESLAESHESSYLRSPKINYPVLGFRKFTINPINKTLNALYKDYIWESGVNFFNCRFHAWHRSPGWSDCNCGFNAFFSIVSAEEYCSRPSLDILAAIAGAGNTAIHEKGFRSSEAQILALYCGEENKCHKDVIEATAKAYGVPVFYSKKKFSRFVRGLITGSEKVAESFPETKKFVANGFPKSKSSEIVIILTLALFVLAFLFWMIQTIF